MLSWNLFHGRDSPPDSDLLTWRSRLLRVTERGTTHAQVNCDLFDSFAAVIAEAEWDIALLQECPPRWAEGLAIAADAEAHLALTSRNLPLIGRAQGVAAAFNPDLIASWEGGSNLTLVRDVAGVSPAIAEREQIRLASRPERRVMALTRLTGGLCVTNLHASKARAAAEGELLEGTRIATDWADGAPLVFGGDMNLRPALSGPVFDTLAREHGLRQPTGEWVIDHVLIAGGEIAEAPRQWAPERREVADPTAGETRALLVRLSDHAPIAAMFSIGA